MSPGSRRPAMQCGLWRENAAWVKKAGGAVWSRRANLSRGSKELLVECGLGERICCLGQRNCWRSVVCGEKTPRGSKDLAAECGLWRENAAWVKKAGGAVWFVARKRRVGQEGRWRSVVCGEKTPRGSRRPVVECGLGGRICRVGQESRWCSVV